jgi:hypothetical protein
VYLIRDAEIADVYRLARNLRDGDRLEVASLGLTPIAGLRKTFYSALDRRTALIDGAIAAMWGVSGSAFGHTGYPWLMTAPVIETLPVSFVRQARREVGRMLATHRRLEGSVAAQYAMACRFLETLGFTLGDVQEIGPRKAKFRPFTMER